MLPDTLLNMLKYRGTGQANTQMSPALTQAMSARPSNMQMTPALQAAMGATRSNAQISPELARIMSMAGARSNMQLTPQLSAAMQGRAYPQTPLPQMAQAMASAPQNMSAWQPPQIGNPYSPYLGQGMPAQENPPSEMNLRIYSLGEQYGNTFPIETLAQLASGPGVWKQLDPQTRIWTPASMSTATTQNTSLMPSGRPYTNIQGLVRETNPGLHHMPRNAVNLTQWRKGR